MQVELLSIDKLLPYARNSRTHSDEQVAQIAASIKEFGFTNPILIDKDGIIIAGHGRVMGARKLNMDEVPCIRLSHLTENQKRAYVIADNKLALNAGWDDDILSLELADLKTLEFDLGLTGFSDDELTELLALNDATPEGNTDEDAVPEAPAQPITAQGDVWLLGKHRLMCGDSTSVDAVSKLLGGGQADMVFTDPPYGIDYSGGRTKVVAKKEYGKIKNDDLQGNSLGNLISNIFLFNKNTADIYICVSPIMQKPFLDFIDSNDKKIDAVIVWDKKNAGLGYMAYRRQCEFIIFIKGGEFKKGDASDFDLWSIGRDGAQNYIHGTQKPVALPERALKNSSKAGETVLDFFGGSGSTLIACEKTGRINRSMELDPKYCDVIVKRWQDYTGKKATLESTGEAFPS